MNNKKIQEIISKYGEEKLEELINIEKLELKYLNKYYFFLKFAEDEMFEGFATKEKIKDDWFGLYGTDKAALSDFAVGAERIVYSLINGKGIGQPNSSPVGADLFFEVEDAFIHIDMKTVNLNNLNDFTSSIFVGRNQNSYKAKIKTTGKVRNYNPALPTYYNKGKDNQKICLSYFITILYDRDDLSIHVIDIKCMPNGELVHYYGDRVLSAGKTHSEARFNISNVNKFELVENEPYRIKVVYFDTGISSDIKKKLNIYNSIYNFQNGLTDNI